MLRWVYCRKNQQLTEYDRDDRLPNTIQPDIHPNIRPAGYSRTEYQGWISNMGIDGPIFVPKSGYFLPILVKVCVQKLAFS